MRVRLRQLLIAALGLVGAMVTGPREVPAQQPEIIRKYTAQDAPVARWKIGREPRTVVGGLGASGPAEFQMIGVIRPIDHDGIVVADVMAAQIKMFDRRGTHVRTMGRRGRGPGEFGAIYGLWRIGDSLAGMDEVGMMQLFTLDGDYVRTIPRPTARGFSVNRLGYLRNGSLIGHVIDPLEDAPLGPSTRFVTLLRIDPDGQQHTLGRFPGVHLVRRSPTVPAINVIYGPRFISAVLSDRICLGFPDQTYEFRCIDAEGGPLVTVSREVRSIRRVTEADKQTYFHLLDSANRTPRAAEGVKRLRAITSFAKRFSPYGRFVRSETDDLWVGPVVPAESGTFLNPVPPEPTVWSVYSRDGEWRSDVTLPARFRLVAVDRDRVIGVVLDPEDEGVEKIVVYPLLRR